MTFCRSKHTTACSGLVLLRSVSCSFFCRKFWRHMCCLFFIFCSAWLSRCFVGFTGFTLCITCNWLVSSAESPQRLILLLLLIFSLPLGVKIPGLKTDKKSWKRLEIRLAVGYIKGFLNQNSVEPLNSDRQTLKKKDSHSLTRFSGGCWKPTTKFCQ